MTKEEYDLAIQDWLSIIDYSDKEQTKWCRENITKIRKEYKNKRKGKNLS